RRAFEPDRGVAPLEPPLDAVWRQTRSSDAVDHWGLAAGVRRDFVEGSQRVSEHRVHGHAAFAALLGDVSGNVEKRGPGRLAVNDDWSSPADVALGIENVFPVQAGDLRRSKRGLEAQ